MEKKKILFISQEITPYLPETEISTIGRELPQAIQEKGREIRTFMPRYGCINERRNQLHEVIRLSGMNIVVDDTDHPLIIKVASIQAARMQVYFIDNEDYFQRKMILKDKEGSDFSDNDERAIFFARGVIETIIKLRWAPDVIHCQGWFAGLVPLFIREIYKNNPLFADTKIMYSAYEDGFTAPLDGKIVDKLLEDEIPAEKIELLKDPSYLNFNKLVAENCDALAIGGKGVDPEVLSHFKETEKPLLDVTAEEDYINAYNNFYDTL